MPVAADFPTYVDYGAALVRFVADDPPAGWPLERRQEYFDWAKSVIDGVRGVSPVLEARFDELYARGPK